MQARCPGRSALATGGTELCDLFLQARTSFDQVGGLSSNHILETAGQAIKSGLLLEIPACLFPRRVTGASLEKFPRDRPSLSSNPTLEATRQIIDSESIALVGHALACQEKPGRAPLAVTS
jgi:hypothetical protein